MNRLLTIQSFAKRTGIPNSTLRYYETEKLLQPVKRDVNGYRLYSTNQIPLAKLIASLRVVNIPIQEIRNYLQLEEGEKTIKKQEWMETLKVKQNQLSIALKYLQSSKADDVYLVEKKSEYVCWFHCEEEEGRFGKHLVRKRLELEKQGIKVENMYLKYVSGRKMVNAQIGVGINPKQVKLAHSRYQIEDMNASFCIATFFQGDFSQIALAYKKIMVYASEHQWIPTGPIIEWYRDGQLEEVDIMMPVTKFGGGDE